MVAFLDWPRAGSGLIVATAAGVHPGFTGCLTLELSTVGEIPIVIKPGLRISQLFFHSVLKSDNHATVDASQFNARRTPALGNVKQDRISRALGKSR